MRALLSLLVCGLLLSPVSAEEPRLLKVFVDLQPRGNKPLDEAMNDAVYQGDDLAELPQGELHAGEGVEFRIGPKCVVLSGVHAPDRADKVEGLSVESKIAGLQILQACGWGAYGGKGNPINHFQEDGTLIGHYRVNYEDGDWEFIPIVYGRDVRDWWGVWDNFKPTTQSRMAWRGTNKHLRGRQEAKNTKEPLRLFLTTWTNPRPEVKVMSIDMVSAKQIAAPFCIAITALALDQSAAGPTPDKIKVAQLKAELVRQEKELAELRAAEVDLLKNQIDRMKQDREAIERLRKELDALKKDPPAKP